MKEIDLSSRLEFLAETFNVFTTDEESLSKKIEEIRSSGYEPSVITDTKEINSDDIHNIHDISKLLNKKKNSKILALVSVKAKTNKEKDTEHYLKRVSVSSDVFSAMIAADPTENKMYLQWMLNLFSRYLKSENSESMATAIRFVKEDLPQANAYLILFEANKRKRLFRDLCKSGYLKAIEDPTDIYQYKSLAQLFDAVDPFIVKEASTVEKMLLKFVEAGKAIIPVKDRKFTLYIPLSLEASEVFEQFANWCTAKKGNGMFKSYTEGNKKPNGQNSNLYIVINNKFFTKESEEIYQIHFETNQIKNKKNDQNVSIFETVINESEGISKFFYDELMGMAKQNKTGIESNKYLDYLINFGFAESLFEFMESDTPSIRFTEREITRLPDLSRFKDVTSIAIPNAKLQNIHPSIGNLKKLEVLSLPKNKITILPKEIGNLKSLEFLNIAGNMISDIPNEITYLDKANGGRLFRIAVNAKDIGEANYQKLIRLLPTTEFSEELKD